MKLILIILLIVTLVIACYIHRQWTDETQELTSRLIKQKKKIIELNAALQSSLETRKHLEERIEELIHQQGGRTSVFLSGKHELGKVEFLSSWLRLGARLLKKDLWKCIGFRENDGLYIRIYFRTTLTEDDIRYLLSFREKEVSLSNLDSEESDRSAVDRPP